MENSCIFLLVISGNVPSNFVSCKSRESFVLFSSRKNPKGLFEDFIEPQIDNNLFSSVIKDFFIALLLSYKK